MNQNTEYVLLVRWPDGTLEQHAIYPGEILRIGPEDAPDDSPVPMIGAHGSVLGDLVIRRVGPKPEWMVATARIVPISGHGARRELSDFMPTEPADSDHEDRTEPDLSVPRVICPDTHAPLIPVLEALDHHDVSVGDAKRISALADYCTAHEVMGELHREMFDARCWTERGHMRRLTDRLRNCVQVMLGSAEYIIETPADAVDLGNLSQPRPRGTA